MKSIRRTTTLTRPDGAGGGSRRPAGDADAKAVLVVALCGIEFTQGSIRIDRKFHTGMLGYASRLNRPLACLVPEGPSGAHAIEVPQRGLPYRIYTVADRRNAAHNRSAIDAAVRASDMACIGIAGWLPTAVAESCIAQGVPYVAVSEYSLRTELDMERARSGSFLRRILREIRGRYRHRRKLRLVARAVELHANGYPTFHELAKVNPRRHLYFDTRAREANVVSEVLIHSRLASRRQRPFRLIFSGQFHPKKGAVDVVRVGIELHRIGVDFRLDLYGEGPVRQDMEALITRSAARQKIHLHEPVPFEPDLVDATKQADVFICCHVQGDPSCTYLETFACGVPIAGYANEMWSELCSTSGGGVAVPTGDHRALARAVASLLDDDERLRAASLSARSFAVANTMERAFDLRTSRLNELLVTNGSPA